MAPGGKPKYTQSDVAASLSGLEYPVYCYALVKFCGQSAQTALMQDEVRRKAVILSEQKRWQGNTEYVQGMADMAIDEHIQPGLCKVCRGEGSIEKMSCESCRGKGVRPRLSSKEAAKLCHPNMTASAWRKTWSARYDDIFKMIQDWDGMIADHITRRLFRN
jgi:hypothetical protein